LTHTNCRLIFYAFVGVFMYFLCGFAENKRGDKMDKIKNVWEKSRRSANTLAVLKSLAVTLACLLLLVLGFTVTGSLIGLY